MTGKVIGGFAGATADAFTLFERLEKKLEQYNGQLLRAAVELAKDWRTDKYLRNLEAMMIVADAEQMLILTGNGDVLEPEGGIAAIGSGGNYALSAAKALADYEQDPEVLARRAMQIAAEVCVFTNDRLTIETVESRELSVECCWQYKEPARLGFGMLFDRRTFAAGSAALLTGCATVGDAASPAAHRSRRSMSTEPGDPRGGRPEAVPRKVSSSAPRRSARSGWSTITATAAAASR